MVYSYPEASATGESKEKYRPSAMRGSTRCLFWVSLPRHAAFYRGYARNAAGCTDAHSIELDPATAHPVIALMPDQNGVEDIGGTLRLGAYPAFWIRLPELTGCTVRRRSMSATDIAMR